MYAVGLRLQGLGRNGSIHVAFSGLDERSNVPDTKDERECQEVTAALKTPEQVQESWAHAGLLDLSRGFH